MTHPLPDWFDIRRYDAAKDLDAEGWYRQLSIRAGLIEFYQDWLNVGDSEEAKKFADHYFNLIRENPIIPPGDGRKNLDLSVTKYYGRAIRSLTIKQAWLLGQGVGRWPERLKECQTSVEEWDLKHPHVNRPYDLEIVETESFIGNGMDFEGIANVAIDLHASDEQLIEDFKAWLIEARRELRMPAPCTHKKRGPKQPASSQRFTKSHFDEWGRQRVLAFIDLRFWKDVNGLELSYPEYSAVLFPTPSGIQQQYEQGDNIRRTIKPLADKLLSRTVITSLLKQAQQKSVEAG